MQQGDALLKLSVESKASTQRRNDAEARRKSRSRDWGKTRTGKGKTGFQVLPVFCFASPCVFASWRLCVRSLNFQHSYRKHESKASTQRRNDAKARRKSRSRDWGKTRTGNDKTGFQVLTVFCFCFSLRLCVLAPLR